MQTTLGFTSLCVGAALVLSACGGGGSSDMTPSGITPVSGAAADLSIPGTAQKIAVDASTQTISQGLDLESSGSVPSVSGAQTSASLSPSNMTLDSLVQHWVGAALALASSNTVQKVLSAAETRQTVNCPDGGQATLIASLKYANSLNTGDAISLISSNCSVTEKNGTKVWMDGSFAMTIDAGSFVPNTLIGATVSVRMGQLRSRVTEPNVATVSVGSHGGMQMVVSNNRVRIKSLPDGSVLTQVNESKTPVEKTTLSAFDYTIDKQTSSQVLFSGAATVDTTRVSMLTGGASRYTITVPTSSPLVVNPTTDGVLSGQTLITSNANNSKVRLNYGVSCSGTTSCVTLEQDKGNGNGYSTIGTYTWADFLKLK